MKFGKYKIDVFILMPVLLLIFFSIAIVYSASSDYALQKWNDAGYLFKQHLIRVVISFVVLFFFAKFDYRYLQDLSKPLIFLAIVLLAVVLFTTSSVKNVNRWLSLGFLSFQPSDLAKYALIIHVSTLLVRKEKYLDNLYRGFLPILIYLMLVCGLVALQPNFSTALIIFGSTVLLMLTSTVKLKHVAITMLSLLPIAALFILSKSYIRERLENFAEYSSSGTAQHQLSQAIVGLGNGGIFGVGIGNSIQKEFFLPESYGDFIFSIVGEEYGFIGTLFVIAMFAIILYRGYKTAKKVQDPFGKYLAFGITTLIVSYAVVNMSVASGIFPTTGVPIPFVSFGGTALILNSIAAGILLNISSFRDVTADAIEEEKKVSA
ncbi:MAG: putative peptidoglycan glycosyltransferase FtsW [Ignavibacteria bacterium]|nr:putative peptidoglycan glycosyltransferase FtsW [Ignavibacteria bacterium]